jgi:hypothetical protein
MKKTGKLLSAYTIARYCSDMDDVKFGMDEIWEKFWERRSAGKSAPVYFFTRLAKLNEKRDLLTEKNKTG